MQTNPMKAALAAGRLQIGTWINLVRNPAGKDAAMLVQSLDEAERWVRAGVKIIAYSSDAAVLRSGYAAAVRRLRPDG